MGSELFRVSQGASHPYDLEDGRQVAAGDEVEIDSSTNRDLIEQGILLPIEKIKAPTVSDAATKKAEELGVDLSEVTPTGNDGKSVTVADVEAAAKKKEGNQ